MSERFVLHLCALLQVLQLIYVLDLRSWCPPKKELVQRGHVGLLTTRVTDVAYLPVDLWPLQDMPYYSDYLTQHSTVHESFVRHHQGLLIAHGGLVRLPHHMLY